MTTWRPEPDLKRLIESRRLKSPPYQNHGTEICGAPNVMSNLFGCIFARLNGSEAA